MPPFVSGLAVGASLRGPVASLLEAYRNITFLPGSEGKPYLKALCKTAEIRDPL